MFLLLVQRSDNAALRYRTDEQSQSVRGAMIREELQRSVWANLLAVLSVMGAIGVLYLPLVLQ
jgi:hypothetical protein